MTENTETEREVDALHERLRSCTWLTAYQSGELAKALVRDGWRQR